MASEQGASVSQQRVLDDAMAQLVKRCKQLESENEELKKQCQKEQKEKHDLMSELKYEQWSKEVLTRMNVKNEGELNNARERYQKIKAHEYGLRKAKSAHLADKRKLKHELNVQKSKSMRLEGAIEQLRQQIEGFQVLIISGGPNAHVIQQLDGLIREETRLKNQNWELEFKVETYRHQLEACENQYKATKEQLDHVLAKASGNAEVARELSIFIEQTSLFCDEMLENHRQIDQIGQNP